MKRLFLLLAVVGISFTACTEVGEIDEIGTTEQPDNGNTGNPETPADPENPENPETQIIKFQDENAKLICILHWDENEDGELSYEEAAAVTNLGTAFKDSRILSFTELKYFTSLKNIAIDEFKGCVSLVKISLPEQITTIGENAFSGCINLSKIVIPNSVTSIGISAFYNCTSLTSVTTPDSVSSIGKSAFENCGSLTSVIIPNGVTSIEQDTFNKIKELEALRYHLSVDGFMTRASALNMREQIRISKIKKVFYCCYS